MLELLIMQEKMQLIEKELQMKIEQELIITSPVNLRTECFYHVCLRTPDVLFPSDLQDIFDYSPVEVIGIGCFFSDTAKSSFHALCWSFLRNSYSATLKTCGGGFLRDYSSPHLFTPL